MLLLLLLLRVHARRERRTPERPVSLQRGCGSEGKHASEGAPYRRSLLLQNGTLHFPRLGHLAARPYLGLAQTT